MNHSYWHQRWQEQRIGFHLETVNPFLERHLPSLDLPKNSRVFVPLCGKTHDMVYLFKKGYRVLGNELSPVAVQDFYTEQQIESKAISSDNGGTMTYWKSDGIDIICGDFFALQKEQLVDIKAVYDRASMVAMPPEMRQKYVQQLRRIIPRNTQILLLTLDYNQNEKQGPPFAVSEKEVYKQYQDAFDIQILEVKETPQNQRSPFSQNLSCFHEMAFLLR
eukprot:GHVP01010525.1.p1 GENE.GHVP01010525.1~~GHVP01010525.1.p1  ORF type:complete len:220 (-),score=28.87 GHVP01010525.1:630-1289(-)